MKTLITFFLLSSAAAFGGTLEDLHNSNATPFEVLMTAFNSASDIKLDAFFPLGDQQVDQYTCAWAFKNTTRRDLYIAKGSAPQLVKASVSAGIPSIPSAGPLFPKVEASEDINNANLVWVGGNDLLGDEFWLDHVKRHNIKLYPNAVPLKQVEDDKTYLFRMSADGAYHIKTIYKNERVEYMYCYSH